jgi:hypothetical protein
MVQKYNISENSKRSYQKLSESGKLTRYKALIIAELRTGSFTRRILAKKLKAGHPSNLCAALKELEREGFIMVLGSIQDTFTGREVNVYGLSQTESPYISIGDLHSTCVHFEGLLDSKNASL